MTAIRLGASRAEKHWEIRAASPDDRRPTVVDRKKDPVTSEDEMFYGGCYVNAILSVYYVERYNRVCASLNTVQFFGNGERFGEAPIDIDEFLDDLE